MGTWTRQFLIVSAASWAIFACDHKEKPANDSGVGATPQQPAAADCPADKADACKATKAKLVTLATQRDQAQAKKDGTALSRVLIEINHQNELLRLDQQDEQDSAKYAAVESQYQQLQKLNEDWIASQAAKNPQPPVTPPPVVVVTPKPPVTGGNPTVPVSPLAYDPREANEVARVLHDFGDLYIAESAPIELKLDQQPWAGYWYGYGVDAAYAGDDAPLVKLDKVITDMALPDHPADTAAKERQLVPGTFDASEGHCAAWATAAITSKEPTGPVTFHGQTFSIGDQKLLLLKTRESWPINMYGISYSGIDTDGTGQDLRPEAWHQLTVKMLGERHQSFYFDQDPGPEVWSVPISGYRWTVTADPEHKDAYLVNAQVFVTSFRNDLTDADVLTHATKDALGHDRNPNHDQRSMTYDYRLYVDRSQVKDGKYKVIAGEWIVGAIPANGSKPSDSVKWHPDSATIVNPTGAMKSFNPEINKNLDVIVQILNQ